MTETSWIWGRYPVLEALRAGNVRTIRVVPGRDPARVLDEIRSEALSRQIPIVEVSARQLEQMARGHNMQGVAAEVVRRPPQSLQSILSGIDKLSAPAFLLALDQIQDPHNFGALLRTADAAGVHAVIMPQRRSAALSGVVAKTSAGASSHLTVVEVINLARALDEIRAAHIWTVGLDGLAARSFFQIDLRVPLTLVLGSEGSGLRRLTRERCDFLGHLPMLGQVESLNASVAGSIAMYEAVRQRLPGNAPELPTVVR